MIRLLLWNSADLKNKQYFLTCVAVCIFLMTFENHIPCAFLILLILPGLFHMITHSLFSVSDECQFFDFFSLWLPILPLLSPMITDSLLSFAVCLCYAIIYVCQIIDKHWQVQLRGKKSLLWSCLTFTYFWGFFLSLFVFNNISFIAGLLLSLCYKWQTGPFSRCLETILIHNDKIYTILTQALCKVFQKLSCKMLRGQEKSFWSKINRHT